jgi:ACS family hexuronate transporter-like MFS transporter
MRLKITGLRWYIVILLTLVTTINYIDRTSLSVAAPILQEQLHINAQQYAHIISCFLFCYMIMMPLSGRIIDYLNMRRGFSLAVIWWSIANMLHALARTPLTFGILRGALGIGEAANFPCIAKTASEWSPPKERTMVTGIANIGSGTGTLIATPLVAFLILKFGWQASFVITGAIGFVWVGIWLLLYYPPEKHPMITPEELDHIRQGEQELLVEEAPSEKGVWKIVLRQRNFWGIGIARFLSEPAWQFFISWIPLYLSTQKGMNLKEIGLFAWIPFLAADLGSFVGGLLSPAYQKLGIKVLTARKLAFTTAALLMPFALLITKAPSPGWAIFWFCFGGFGHQCISATVLTLPADLFPKRTVATASGLAGFMGYFGGIMFTQIVGLLAMHKDYAPIFTMIAFFDIIGATLVWILLRTPQTQLDTVGSLVKN